MACLLNQETSEPQTFGIRELIPVRVSRQESSTQEPRLNLVIPGISKKVRSSGGITTALRLLERLQKEFKYVRLVVTHEGEAAIEPADWSGWVKNDGTFAPQSVVFLQDQDGILPLAATDCFIATFWSTATYVSQVLKQQLQWYSGAIRRYVYLIQEYEPGFYAGSARHEYAKATYRDHDNAIAIFNSTPVDRYFKSQGLHFREHYAFDPMFHPKLLRKKSELGSTLKERVVLAYGRPETAQNDFDLVVESLRRWATEFPLVRDWQVLSAGQPHADVPLGNGVMLQSLGTLTLDDYALQLARSWVGISFAFNASTSYTAREMAEFGAWVITNQFEYKKPTDLPANVFSLDQATPESVAHKLAWCCEQFHPGKTAVAPNLGSVFRREGEEFPFVDSLLKSWFGER